MTVRIDAEGKRARALTLALKPEVEKWATEEEARVVVARSAELAAV